MNYSTMQITIKVDIIFFLLLLKFYFKTFIYFFLLGFQIQTKEHFAKTTLQKAKIWKKQFKINRNITIMFLLI